MHPVIEKLLAAGPIATDGAWGTQLQQRGLPVGANPELWNLQRLELVEEVARAYVEAGSNVILTNTFGANRFILARHQLADQAAALNEAGAAISLRAADGRAAVFASIGPTGVMLMMGQTSENDLRAAFVEQAQALARAGVHGLVVETMSDPAEAVAAVAAAHETGLPVVACMTFDSGAKLDRTMMGTTPEQASEQLLAAGADCVGFELRPRDRRNRWKYAAACTPPPVVRSGSRRTPACRRCRMARRRTAQTAEQFAGHIPALIANGAGMIGGCCGTTPEFIVAVRRQLDRRAGK